MVIGEGTSGMVGLIDGDRLYLLLIKLLYVSLFLCHYIKVVLFCLEFKGLIIDVNTTGNRGGSSK